MPHLITSQPQPNFPELHRFFELVFTEITDNDKFEPDQNQSLDDWFALDKISTYLEYGQLLETRTDDNQLVGALFIGQQNPLTWPDGHKMEIFILGVHPDYQHQGIAQKLVASAEDFARQADCKKIIVNTHVAMTSVHSFYQKAGYEVVGQLTNYYDNGDALFFAKIL